MLKKILQGMVVGIANIIPGVSGGTMMVAMGLYDKLIHSITHLKSDFKNSMKLLIPIFLGAGIAIVALSRLFEFLLREYPIPTNFAFCGLIAGSLPFIFKKVQGHKTSGGKIAAFIVFFAVVILMALLGETGGKSADVTFGVINVIKLLFVGIIAAATMVVPGVSGSMMLMTMGYYYPVIGSVKDFITALVAFDAPKIIHICMILIPFGIGVVVGIFAVAKLIEMLMDKYEALTYCGIMGLVVASPVVILMSAPLAGMSVVTVLTGAVTFVVGVVIALCLGK